MYRLKNRGKVKLILTHYSAAEFMLRWLLQNKLNGWSKVEWVDKRKGHIIYMHNIYA